MIRGSLEKAKKTSRLVPKKIMVTREGKPYQTTVWVLPEEAQHEKPSVIQPDIFETAELEEKINAKKPKLVIEVKKDNKSDSIPEQFKDAPIKKVTAIITSKGRKYFKAKFPGKQWEFNVVINSASENYEVGSTVTFDAKEDREVSKYGIKTTYYPLKISENEKNILEIKRWLGYVEEKAKDGYFYEKGYDKLKELGVEKYPEYHQKLKGIMRELRIKNLQHETSKWLGYIQENIKDYWYKKGEAMVTEKMAELEKLGIDIKPYKEKLESLHAQYRDYSREKADKRREKMLASMTSAQIKNKIANLYAEARRLENSDSEDNVSGPISLRAEADELYKVWRAKYPNEAKLEDAEELEYKAARQEDLARGALLYDSDGWLSKEEQQRRHDEYMRQAAEYRQQARALRAEVAEQQQ